VKAHVRVVAATHQNLEQRVKDGAFREDLFHRLNVIRLRLPALRERREDIAMLTRHFLQVSARQLGVDPKRISDAALARLEGFAFPGNVRQLENICHWLTVMAPAQVISVQDLPPEVLRAGPEPVALEPEPRTAAPASAAAAPEAHAPQPAAPSVFAQLAGEVRYVPQAEWEHALVGEVRALLASGRTDVWDVLAQRFESCLIASTLDATHGRRMEAAQRLGIGRNTITRKIQELGLDGKNLDENGL
jgi:two-component system nitrogen regulation response regulator GlnG